MLKKMLVMLLVSCFLSNTITYSVLALNTETNNYSSNKKIFSSNIASFSKNNDHFEFGQSKEFTNSINMLLEKIKNMDMSEVPFLEVLLNSNQGNISIDHMIERYQFLIDLYLEEISNRNSEDPVPGCLSDYYFSFLLTFGLTPLVAYFALFSLSDDEVRCMWSWGFAALATFTWGLISWTNYRICAEQKSDDPDQENVNQLLDDKEFLKQMSLINTVIAISLGKDCGRDYLEVFNN